MTTISSDDARALDRDVAGAAGAHQALLASLDDVVDDLDPSTPSLLPGWTVGHVVTHIARNADAHVWMVREAAEGRVGDQYPSGEHADSFARRAADIEEGATRAADELVADLRRSIWALEAAWATCDWAGAGRMVTGAEIPLHRLPFLRWRETAVHHIDLGLGATFDDLPAEYVRLELRQMEMLWTARQPMGLTGIPESALALAPPARLAWFMGRLVVDDLPPAGIF